MENTMETILNKLGLTESQFDERQMEEIETIWNETDDPRLLSIVANPELTEDQMQELAMLYETLGYVQTRKFADPNLPANNMRLIRLKIDHGINIEMEDFTMEVEWEEVIEFEEALYKMEQGVPATSRNGNLVADYENILLDSKFYDVMHVYNFYNYLYRTDRGQKHTNDRTKYNMFLSTPERETGVSEVMDMQHLIDLEKRKAVETEEVNHALRTVQLKHDKLRMGILYLENQQEETEIDEYNEYVAELFGKFLQKKIVNREIVTLVAHIDQGTPHIHFVYVEDNNELKH